MQVKLKQTEYSGMSVQWSFFFVSELCARTDTYMEITLSPPHVTPSHGDSPQGSSDWPQDGGAFCH